MFAANLLKGQVAVITGHGSSSARFSRVAHHYRPAELAVRRESAKQLVTPRAGASVIYAVDLRLTADLVELPKRVLAAGCRTQVVPVTLDVGSEAGTKDMVARIMNEQGRLDVWWANAGFVDMKGLWQTSADDLRRSFDVMTIGPFLAARYGSPAMATVGLAKTRPTGSIIVTGSIASITGSVATMAYTVAKHAAHAVTKSAATELSQTEVRINTIAPGLLQTNLWQNSVNAGQAVVEGGASTTSEEALAKTNTATDYQQRTSTSSEIADLGVFLCSEAAQCINGQIIVADRGATARPDLSWNPVPPVTGGWQPPPLL